MAEEDGGRPGIQETDSALDRPLTPLDVDRLFQMILDRDVGDPVYVRETVSTGKTLGQLMSELLGSAEYWYKRRASSPEIPGGRFRVPDDLRVTEAEPECVLLVGSCAIDAFHARIAAHHGRTRFRRLTFNNGSILPPLTDEEGNKIAFQLVQLPIRSVMPELMYLNDQYSEESAQSWFELSKQLLHLNYDAATAYNRDHGIQTFVMNFQTPQQNALGRLQHPYRLQNAVHYVAELNRELFELVSKSRDTYLIDAEQISASLGKRFVQDDSVLHLNHGSTLTGLAMGGDETRIEPIGDVLALAGERVDDFNLAVYEETLAAYRSLRQLDAIKMVIFDLDDTLWRGVAAEQLDDLGFAMTEGWPLGILEAASFLHKRGIMIAVVSKNDRSNVVRAWDELYQNRFPLENFVACEVNWQPKAENVARILSLANIGQDAVLFVDDNPVERAHVRAAFPAMRTLERSLAEWRRILLWSAELQPATITDEARDRSASIQAKATRDEASQSLDPQAFLDNLDLRVTPSIVADSGSPRFARCLELINKTNQFNTTGRRWTERSLKDVFKGGGYLLSLAVQDRYASYGIVGVLIVRDAHIFQFVLSCRVFGMQIEQAAIALACRQALVDGHSTIYADLVETERNHLARSIFQQTGFTRDPDNMWSLSLNKAPTVPGHIAIVEV